MTIYEEHFKVKQQIEALTLKQKELEEKILDEIKDLSAPMRLPFGSYNTVKRTIYTYPDEISELEKSIKSEAAKFEKEMMKPLEIKKLELIESGDAEVKEIVGIRFTANKDNLFKTKILGDKK